MSAQLELGEHVGPVVSIEADFREFDRANPEVYVQLCRLARQWVRERGAEHLGVKTLYEVTRWTLALRTDAGEGFALNNNYTALYARKMMAHEQDLRGLFSTRGRSDACRCTRCAG